MLEPTQEQRPQHRVDSRTVATAGRDGRAGRVLTLRPAGERFQTRTTWLDSRHTFSFGEHYDPRHIGFGALRVINDDRVAAGAGFSTHGHRDMEILSYVLDGELAHRDSLGHGSIIRPGEVQRMNAGTGVLHSERNPQTERATHFLQIWIVPAERGLTPSYEQKRLAPKALDGRLCLVASPDGREGSMRIHQDASLYLMRLGPGEEVVHEPAVERRTWVHVATGELRLDAMALEAGDGVGIEQARALRFEGTSGAEVLVFDLG